MYNSKNSRIWTAKQTINQSFIIIKTIPATYKKYTNPLLSQSRALAGRHAVIISRSRVGGSCCHPGRRYTGRCFRLRDANDIGNGHCWKGLWFSIIFAVTLIRKYLSTVPCDVFKILKCWNCWRILKPEDPNNDWHLNVVTICPAVLNKAKRFCLLQPEFE